MESGGVAVPDLSALEADDRKRPAELQSSSRARRKRQATFSFSSNLALHFPPDAVPKPFPFPEAASKQFAELRDAAFRSNRTPRAARSEGLRSFAPAIATI